MKLIRSESAYLGPCVEVTLSRSNILDLLAELDRWEDLDSQGPYGLIKNTDGALLRVKVEPDFLHYAVTAVEGENRVGDWHPYC
jgi:hypothetical protein